MSNRFDLLVRCTLTKYQPYLKTVSLIQSNLCRVFVFCRGLYSNMVKILLYIQKATETIFNVALQSDIRTNGTAARNPNINDMHTTCIGLWEAVLFRFNIWTEARNYIHISSIERRGSKSLAQRHGWQRTRKQTISFFFSCLFLWGFWTCSKLMPNFLCVCVQTIFR